MKKFVLPVLVFILISGCIFTQQEGKSALSTNKSLSETSFEVFSYLPDEGAEQAILIDSKDAGFIGLAYPTFNLILGEKIMKNMEEFQYAEYIYGSEIVRSNEPSAYIIKLKTNLSFSEALKAVAGQIGYTTNETRQIGNKDVMLLYANYDTRRIEPLCIWGEGEELDIMRYDTGLGAYGIQSGLTPKTNMTCDKALQNKYDTKKAEELLKGSNEIKKRVMLADKNFSGEILDYEYGINKYTSAFGDDNAFYILTIAERGRESYVCYNESFPNWEVVRSRGKEACLKNLLVIDYGFYQSAVPSEKSITLERGVGNYSLRLVAMIKKSREAVVSSAEDIIFGLNFLGEEKKWIEKKLLKMNLTVNIFERNNKSQEFPIGYAKVEVYNGTYYQGETNYGGTPITAYSDEKGIVKFENLEMSEYKIVVSKQGYPQVIELASPSNSSVSINISVMLRNVRPLRVLVRGGPTYGNFPNLVDGAKVELYNRIDGNYTLIKTEYTNSQGIADFGEVDLAYGKVEASKEDYEDGIDWIGISTENSTVLLREIERFTVTVKNASNFAPIDGAKAVLFNYSDADGYRLVDTEYTDSNGIAYFGRIELIRGRIEISKDGYINQTYYRVTKPGVIIEPSDAEPPQEFYKSVIFYLNVTKQG